MSKKNWEFSLVDQLVSAQNISCYQCTRNTYAECFESELLPCETKHDRCVVSIKQDGNEYIRISLLFLYYYYYCIVLENGFELKRECGLGPCTFNDAMLDEKLKWNDCDRTKKSFFCFTCCKGNGCNKSGSDKKTPPAVLALTLTILLLLAIVKNYQPPYLPLD